MGLMTVAFGDESDDTHNKRAYVVSGLLAPLPEWVELERLWRKALGEEHLTEFHAAKCDNRRKPFDVFDADQRARFQRIFYGIVSKLQIWGFAAAIELPAYRELQDVFDRNRPDYSHPYFLAFQFALELMSSAVDKAGFDKDEVIHFVFDRQQQFQDRAKTFYDAVIERPGERTWTHRLGGLTFDSRLCHLQLQAADIFAYESRKWVSDVKLCGLPDSRWQWHVLRDTTRVGVWGLTGESLDNIVAREQWT